MNEHTSEPDEQLPERWRIALVGKLAGMSRRDAEQLIRERGGLVAAEVDAETHWAVVGDDTSDVDRKVASPDWLGEAARTAWHEGRLRLVRESEFWSRLGLVDARQGVRRLYTPAMLAELVAVPVRAVRHWHRKSRLEAAHQVGRLPYFDFEEVRVARRLAALLAAGCSLSQIDRKLDELARLRPNVARPLADAAVVVVGSRLYVRHGESLTEPSGQLLIDFDAAADVPGGRDLCPEATTIPISAAAHPHGAGAWKGALAESLGTDDLRSLAEEFEESGQPERAIEVYRALLMSGQFTAEDHFFLAELLYRSGDLPAARERYYAAIELDDDYVEARANLGCVLAEQGEHALAEAAFRGALAYHGDFADAHYHLARLLDNMDQPREAAKHWRRFLDLAPASPWAEEALDRTGEGVSP